MAVLEIGFSLVGLLSRDAELLRSLYDFLGEMCLLYLETQVHLRSTMRRQLSKVSKRKRDNEYNFAMRVKKFRCFFFGRAIDVYLVNYVLSLETWYNDLMR